MKRFIRSDESSDFIREHQNKPEGGYLYIFKHGIGPGTLPKDVEVIKTKDLPNGYTAVWTDRFLTTKEMDQYDIPYETEINRYLERIGYCQKSGDVVPCDDIEACGDIKASSTKYSADMCSITGASNSLVYENYGDVNFADTGRLVAEDPSRPGCYYVILCNPMYDTDTPTWIICEEYVDTSDDWFDIDAIADWAGDYVREDPAELAVCVIDYYGPQSTQGWKKYSSQEAEDFLNSLNVNGEVYWGASI